MAKWRDLGDHPLEDVMEKEANWFWPELKESVKVV
jgi:hypothetical protein